MIKNLEKFKRINGDYLCGLCGQIFQKEDINGHRISQKTYLKPGTYLKFGNETIAIIPKCCYKCYSEAKKKVINSFK